MLRRAALFGTGAGAGQKLGSLRRKDRWLSHSGIFFFTVGFSDLVGGAPREFASQIKGARASVSKNRALFIRGGGGRSKLCRVSEPDRFESESR
jgi:hypothetical protein